MCLCCFAGVRMHEDFRSTKGAEDPCAETQRALCTYLWILGSADHAPGASGLWNMFVVDMARLKAERRRKVKWESEMLSQQYLDDFVPMVFRTTNQIKVKICPMTMKDSLPTGLRWSPSAGKAKNYQVGTRNYCCLGYMFVSRFIYMP